MSDLPNNAVTTRSITSGAITAGPKTAQQKKGVAWWLGFMLAALIVGAAFLFVVTLIVALIAAIGALL